MSRKDLAGPAPRALLAALSSLTLFAAHSARAEDPNEVIIVGHADRPVTVQPRGLSVSLGQTEFEAINAVNVEDMMK